MKYIKNTPRLTVQFVNSDTEKILFEIKDRTWMNIGEILTDVAINSIMNVEFKGKPPKNLMVLVIGEYELK